MSDWDSGTPDGITPRQAVVSLVIVFVVWVVAAGVWSWLGR